MVWGYTAAQGVDHICTIDRRMSAELHTSILQVGFLAIVEFVGSTHALVHLSTG